MSIWAAKRFKQACEDTAALQKPAGLIDRQSIVEQRSRVDPNQVCIDLVPFTRNQNRCINPEYED